MNIPMIKSFASTTLPGYCMFLLLCMSFLLRCNQAKTEHDDGLTAITQTDLERHVSVLASDEFEGRKPFTEGEQKTIAYLQKQFKMLGLEPGNGDSYLQKVPMVEITPTADTTMTFTSTNGKISLRGFHDYVLNTERTDALMVWDNEEVVFAGFGIVAPEYNWNDYANLDVKNKIVLVLVNDPGFGSDDATHFKGNTMTYYGRWTYKYEEAARQGAKGCFVIHNTVPAGYPFAVLQNSWNSAHLYLDNRGKNIPFCEGVGWITKPAVEKLFQLNGLDFNDQQTIARQGDFAGYSLDMQVSTSMKVQTRYDTSHNVVALIKGSERPEEYIIYTAHWDHLGIGKPDAEGDSIYNGAFDNASGTAGLLVVANAFKNLKNPPQRSLVFLAVTAEEQGLWGSAFYAANPVYPLKNTVANINMDGINPYGPMKDIIVVGKGQSELEEYLETEAALLNRVVKGENTPERGYYFRSDHFNFAKVGVPALYLSTGSDFIGKDANYGTQLQETYTQKYYHQPSDEYDTTRMNFEGGVNDLRLLFQVGKNLAAGTTWPMWKPGSEFKAIRESDKK